jgi:hypothetical protein
MTLARRTTSRGEKRFDIRVSVDGGWVERIIVIGVWSLEIHVG